MNTILDAILHRQWEVARRLLETATISEILFKNENGITALHAATLQDNLYLTRNLLIKGAKINNVATYKDHIGMTPLHIAVLFGHKRIVELLLAWEADCEIKNGDSLTALQLALICNHIEIAQMIKGHLDKTLSTPSVFALSRMKAPFIRTIVAKKLKELQKALPGKRGQQYFRKGFAVEKGNVHEIDG